MSDPVGRSWRLTRRTLGGTALALLGLGAAESWPRWAFWRGNGSDLSALSGLPEAAALSALGARVPGGPLSDDEAALLSARLKDGYAAAVAQDRAEGRLSTVDGWLLPETQALAGRWLASAAKG
jgi:hypothetical protein